MQHQALPVVAAVVDRRLLLVDWVGERGGAATLVGLGRLGSNECRRVALWGLRVAAGEVGCRGRIVAEQAVELLVDMVRSGA